MHGNRTIFDNSWPNGFTAQEKKSDLSEKPQGKDHRVHAVGRPAGEWRSDPLCNAMPVKLLFVLRGGKK